MRVGLAVLILCLLAAPAAAEPKVAVTGDDRAGVLAAVRKALDKHVEIVDAEEADAIVEVDVKPAKKKWRATVTARDASGAKLARYDVKARKGKLAKQTAAKAWKKLGKPIRKAAAPATDTVAASAAEPDPVADPDPEADPDPAADPAPVAAAPVAAADPGAASEAGVSARADRPARRRGTVPWLAISVDGRSFLRTLRYKDDYDDQLRAYDLAAPAAGVTATWRPFPRGAARFLAVRGELELALGISGSRTTDGMSYPTRASEWSAGLRGEVPTGALRWTVDAAYGEHRFTIDDEGADGMNEELVPDVTYRWLRGALGVQVPVARTLTVEGSGGWRQLLGTGDLGADPWFPRVTGAGIDAELGATWRPAGPIALFVRADLRRYFFSMNPEVGDPIIVGGAVDQYLGVTAGLGIELR